MDIMVVASHRDFPITGQCLRNLAAYFPAGGRILLATDHRRAGQELIDSIGSGRVAVLSDDDLLSGREAALPGWYRQQIVKLRAGRVLSGESFCVVSGDTLVARTLQLGELLAPDGRPYLYVNRYRYPSRHLEYERRRVRAVAELLDVAPVAALELGDFISDLFCFERALLDAVTRRLEQRFGANWTHILEGRTTQPADQERFGEYTLYSVWALESGSASPPPVRVCTETHVLQLHSRRAFERARFDAPVVHIVDKTLSVDEISARAAEFGVDLRPR